RAGVAELQDEKPLLCSVTPDNAEEMIPLLKESGCPVVARADGYDALCSLVEKLTAAELKDIVLDSGSRKLKKTFEEQVQIRRAALRKAFRPFGYPTITFPCEMTDDPAMEILIAATLAAKYSGIVVISCAAGENVFPLLLSRMNIFTDPQRPMATDPGIYPIGEPDENSPVLITTNFSLTYFIVAGEIESARVPAWLLIMDCEGYSVLTAWSAGKFTPDLISDFVKRTGIESKVARKALTIPGYTAHISGELEDTLKGWEILVGPREASHIPAYLKNYGSS
ncbi:MAG TPA: acetyl-CoA decarbonylase/synthase complex subunit gamma, partial [bacterium]|nr:acetyl-CoA decarbonylase/synthase complex subunit gamma [bacterium]